MKTDPALTPLAPVADALSAIPRRDFLRASVIASGALLLRPVLRGAPAAPAAPFDPTPGLIKAPDDPALWADYREKLAAWRKQERAKLNYSDALYERPDFAWVPSSYACCFLMLCDERFYDVKAGRYRIKEWLEENRREYGGLDSVVLWHAYPLIGFDRRNQFDFYRDVPGGLAGLRNVVLELQQLGLHVYIDYNPWDTGTRREEKSDIDMLCEFVGALNIDGIFLDTMKEGAAEFRAKLDAVRPGVILEGEGVAPVNRIAEHHMSWAQKFVDSKAPGVARNKWFERRHQLHYVDRRSHDRTPEFHSAFMNGAGTMIWDNVFGGWFGYSEREKSILRAMLPIQRRYTPLFCGEQWTPLVPTTNDEVYASRWEGDGIRLWTLVNRAEHEADAGLPDTGLGSGEQWWNLITGQEVKGPRITMRSRDIGCLVAAKRQALGADFDDFLAGQQAIHQSGGWDPTFPAIRPKLRPVPATRAYAPDKLPADMQAIPGGVRSLRINYQTRECGWYDSTPENIPTYAQYHKLAGGTTEVTLVPYAIDLTPVTNKQFAAFLAASGHQPKHREKFLAHWQNGKVPAGKEDHPVVYVDLDDARAYAQWAGKRLPTEEEWQFAAQGPEAFKYPWGNFEPTARPDLCNGWGADTTPVRQYPRGRSPFGLYDMCGNTWEWTESERSDGINRFSILRGGSHYKAMGSVWYTDGGPIAANFGAKFLHTWPGLDRCSTVGFRCVVELTY